MEENKDLENVQRNTAETDEAKRERFKRFLEESEYTPLYLYLKSIPQGQSSIDIAVREVEKLLGFSLPMRARKERSWWANSFNNKRAIFWMIAGWKVNGINTNSETITFARDERVIEKASVNRGDWAKLREFFKDLPLKQRQICLTFEKLGKLRGMALPPTAFGDRPWWANTKRSPQGKAWLTAGWKLETVYINSQIAVFRRTGGNYLQEISEFVKAILEGSQIKNQPGVETLKNWIPLCQKIGWYFEATVIYERGGLRTDLLSEAEKVYLEENYNASKRELELYTNHISAGTS